MKNRFVRDPLLVAHCGVGLVVCAVLAQPACGTPAARDPVSRGLGSVETLRAPRRAFHSYGRAGDLVLQGTDGTSLTFAALDDAPGHRPMKGALLDVRVDASDRADPLLWWRSGWIDADKKLHPLIASSIKASPCEQGAAGVRIEGTVDGVGLDTRVCVQAAGRYSATTTATSLPPGAVLADDLNPGTSEVLVDGDGGNWEGERPTHFAAIAEHGVGFLVQTPAAKAARNLVHIATESFPAAVALRYDGATQIRFLEVLRGDALNAVARVPHATRTLSVGFGADHGGDVGIQDESGRQIAKGHVPRNATRAFRLPNGFGQKLELTDDEGVLRGGVVPMQNSLALIAPPRKAGSIELRYVDGTGGPVPTHVLFRGTSGTEDPAPHAGPRSYAAGRSVYLLDGQGTVFLAPGTYEVTASHGPTFTLSKRTVVVEQDRAVPCADTLKEVVDTSSWVSGDFHLHSAPSPDAPVSLDERVASLVCEGVDLAVATDHNRITDYGPSVRALSVGARIDTMLGDELTSAGPALWGHFNAYPLAPPQGAPEDAVPIYYNATAAQMFASAREHGARIVQVNHARMPPRIGYFDLTHLDPKTGRADDTFSGEFNAFEAFNGIWLQAPDRIREGAVDMVAMARRGAKVAATGNSDSHRLLFEEAGYPRTFVHAPRMPAAGRGARAIDAMLKGDTTVSSGPLVEMTVDGKPIGSTLRLGPSRKVMVHVRVSAPAWVPVEHVEIWRDDVVAQRFGDLGAPRDGVRFEKDVELALDADSVLLAWADAETPLPDLFPYTNARAVGFTGLVYVDADGDGSVMVPPGR